MVDLSRNEFAEALDFLQEHDGTVICPYRVVPGRVPFESYLPEPVTEAAWNSYVWNPASWMLPEDHPDPLASPKPTWATILAAHELIPRVKAANRSHEILIEWLKRRRNGYINGFTVTVGATEGIQGTTFKGYDTKTISNIVSMVLYAKANPAYVWQTVDLENSTGVKASLNLAEAEAYITEVMREVNRVHNQEQLEIEILRLLRERVNNGTGTKEDRIAAADEMVNRDLHSYRYYFDNKR